MKSYALSVIAITFALVACGRKEPSQKDTVRVVSWGGQFQEDLVNRWVKPAAQSSGIELDVQSWDGDYATLADRIRKDLCDWDLVHVEAHFVESDNATPLLANHVDRNLPLLPDELKSPRAVPVLEYAYILTYYTDQESTLDAPPDWPQFFNITNLQGIRALRDVPIGNIEIALNSLGIDVKEKLYNPSLSRTELENTVDKALARLDEIRKQTIWWTTGDVLQKIITSREARYIAAWSGRALASRKSLCPQSSNECVLAVNEKTALVSTDWWIIPRHAPHDKAANALLEAMFNSDKSRQWAADFAVAQGYGVPIKDASRLVRDPVASNFTRIASTDNPNKLLHISETFWGENNDWITAKWISWRAK